MQVVKRAAKARHLLKRIKLSIKCSPFLTSATVGSGQPSAAHSSTASSEPSRTRNDASPVANVDVVFDVETFYTAAVAVVVVVVDVVEL